MKNLEAGAAIGAGQGEDDFGKIETRGIDMIPDVERRSKPYELFTVFFGPQFGFGNMIFGALAIAFGLGWWAAFSAITVGSVAGSLIFLAVTPVSPKTGSAARAPPQRGRCGGDRVRDTLRTMKTEHWKNEPEEQDYPAAVSYLSLLMDPAAAAQLVSALQKAGQLDHYKAKDVLRASQLPLLPEDDKHVASDLGKVKSGSKLSPVLLVRGQPLLVADGYHRVCASYHLDENADIPCRIVDAHGS